MLRYALFVETCVRHRMRSHFYRSSQEQNPQGRSKYETLLSDMDNVTWSANRHNEMRNWLREDMYRDAWITETCDRYPKESVSLSDIAEPIEIRDRKRIEQFKQELAEEPYVGATLRASDQVWSLAIEGNLVEIQSKRLMQILTSLVFRQPAK